METDGLRQYPWPVRIPATESSSLDSFVRCRTSGPHRRKWCLQTRDASGNCNAFLLPEAVSTAQADRTITSCSLPKGRRKRGRLHRPELLPAKLAAHGRPQVAASQELVHTVRRPYKQQAGEEKAIPRNEYVEIRGRSPIPREKAKWPEFKTCKYTHRGHCCGRHRQGRTAESLHPAGLPGASPEEAATDGRCQYQSGAGEAPPRGDAGEYTGICVLQTIVAAVPVRLMKRDLLFIAEQLLPLLDEKRVEMVARNQGIRAKEGESAAGAAHRVCPQGRRRRNRKADHRGHHPAFAIRTLQMAASLFRAAAQVYGVNSDAIALKAEQGVRRAEGESEKVHQASAETDDEGKVEGRATA